MVAECGNSAWACVVVGVRDTSELLATDLERIAEKLRECDSNVLRVNHHGEVGESQTETVEFTVEWLE